MVSRRKVAVSLGIVAVAAISLLVASWAGAQGKATYPRSSTLITSGTQWGNIAGTNPYVGNYATGMVGLVNETLMRYDPLKDKYINWLAKSAKWTSKTRPKRQYTVVLRSNVKWSDGNKLTPNDVAWNIKLGRFDTAFWNTLYKNVKSIKTPVTKVRVMRKGKCVKIVRKGKRVCKTRNVRNKVVINFKGTPNYVQWQNLIWNLPMISRLQAREQIQGPTSLTTYSPNNPVGTGPYKLDTEGYDATQRVVWKKKRVWWAAKQKVAPSPRPTYIIDLCNTSNTNSLAGLLSGIQDLNNNFLPGIETLVAKGQANTYYKGEPYNLSANTAWLTPNTTHKPLNDPAFRKALATSVNVSKIVNDAYHKLVLPASPTGLLPIWKKWINSSLVSSKGFSYSTSRARSMLTAAGYPQSGGNFRNKDGSAIDLKIQVPSGWSDWEAARDLVVSSAAAAGIKIHAVEGDFNAYQQDRNLGKFDLVIDNTAQMSDNPWTYFNFLFNLPIITSGTQQTFANFSRYENTTAWNNVQKLDKTPLTAMATRRGLINKLQTVVMDDMPNIPLWYNGVWSQTQSKYWVNWPSADSSRHYVPCMWRGYLQMTGIDMFTHVKKA